MVGTTSQMKCNLYTILVQRKYTDDEGKYHSRVYMKFPSFDDFRKLYNIEQLMIKLYNKKV